LGKKKSCGSPVGQAEKKRKSPNAEEKEKEPTATPSCGTTN